MNKKSFFAIIAVVAVAAVLFVALHKSQQAPPSGEQKLIPVTVNQAFQHLLYIGLYVAKDEGFFEKQGLDVNIQTGGGDAQAFSALTSGSAQFAQGDPSFVAIANEKGWDGRVVAMAVDRVAIWGVTFNKNIKPFTDPAGFKGLTVATYPEPNTSYVVQKQLDLQAGFKIGDDAKILQVPFGTELATLKNGQADIAQTIEPNVSQVELQGGTVVFSYATAYGPLAFTGVQTSEAEIQQHPEVVQKFVNAYEQALQYIQNNFEGAVAIAKKELPTMDEQVIRTALHRLIDSGSIPAHAKVDPVSWQKLLQIQVDVGNLKQTPTKDLIDNSFAESAIKTN
jgi:NitT/TauT family transport system substrate-binding protein